MTVKVDIKDLFDAGVHFGHKTSHWSPKMAPYIHSKRQDAHIINLEKTVEGLEAALPFITKVVASGKQILFVGTKKHLKEIIKQSAEKAGQPYVNERWLGGTLTNTDTISRQIRKLKDYEKRMEAGELEKRYSKLEVQRIQEEIDSLNLKYSGIKDLDGMPGVVFVSDVIVDANAVKEANKSQIPVIGIVDSNSNPSAIDYVIPGNDDAIKGVKLILDYICEAIKDGASKVKTIESKKASSSKPTKELTEEQKIAEKKEEAREYFN